MLKDLGVQPYVFPMPVLMIATYGEDGKVDVMNMAWGGICAENMVALNLDEDHKTSENIKKRGAFTLSIADLPHIEQADFFGIATGNKMEDKFERSDLHAVKSARVDAPVVTEFPLTLECKVAECQQRRTASACSERSSTCSPTRKFSTKRANPIRKSSTPSCSIRSRAAIMRSEKRSGRRGTRASVCSKNNISFK